MSFDYKFDRKQSDVRENLWGIDWPGHPSECGIPKKVETTRDSLVAEPERWKLLKVTHDPEADYSYDDLACMVREDDKLHILVRTSGCSCPSPTETWGIVCEGTEEDLFKYCVGEKKSWGGKGTWHGPWRKMYDFLLDLYAPQLGGTMPAHLRKES
jgi:hypothetical protein